MSSSFSNSSTAVLPELVDGWTSSRQARSTVQPIIGGGVDVWSQPAAPRSGTLVAVLRTLADAVTLEELLASGDLVTFADSDEPVLGMTFVAQNDITIRQSDGRGSWLVEFGFQEVTP